jgi:hypothetical protein
MIGVVIAEPDLGREPADVRVSTAGVATQPARCEPAGAEGSRCWSDGHGVLGHRVPGPELPGQADPVARPDGACWDVVRQPGGVLCHHEAVSPVFPSLSSHRPAAGRPVPLRVPAAGI